METLAIALLIIAVAAVISVFLWAAAAINRRQCRMSKLRNELIMDPHRLDYAPLLAAGSANQVAALLNEPRYEALGSVPITPLLEWIAVHGIIARLRAAAAGEDAQVASIAEVALMIVANPNIPALAGVVTQAAHDELVELATVPESRAQQLGLGTVTADDVSAAVEG